MAVSRALCTAHALSNVCMHVFQLKKKQTHQIVNLFKQYVVNNCTERLEIIARLTNNCFSGGYNNLFVFFFGEGGSGGPDPSQGGPSKLPFYTLLASLLCELRGAAGGQSEECGGVTLCAPQVESPLI